MEIGALAIGGRRPFFCPKSGWLMLTHCPAHARDRIAADMYDGGIDLSALR